MNKLTLSLALFALCMAVTSAINLSQIKTRRLAATRSKSNSRAVRRRPQSVTAVAPVKDKPQTKREASRDPYEPPRPYAPPQPAYQPEPYHAAPQEYKEPGMPYALAYAVNDEYSGNSFGADVKSDGQLTSGSYSVLLPDGRTQLVSFTSDNYKGYVADVTYEGTAAPYGPPQPYAPPPPYQG